MRTHWAGKALTADQIFNHKVRIENVIYLLKKSGSKKIIDFGCGDGQVIGCFLKENYFENILGVDVDLESVEIARQNYISNTQTTVELVSGGVSALENLNEKYEAIIMVEVIEHMSRKEIGDLAELIFGHMGIDNFIFTTPLAVPRLSQSELELKQHLFEWDKDELESWANEVVKKYPNYEFVNSVISGPTFIRQTQICHFKKSGASF
jgi:SAM-dependent methyltransferase